MCHMASRTVKIGVACPLPGERAACIEWLASAGYEPVPLTNLETLARDMTTRPIEALIADVSLVAPADLPRLVRLLGPNRPLALVGARKDAIEDVPRDATWIDRPATRDSFLLSIGLALAEGRPARKSPRQNVAHTGTVDGVAAKIVDISSEGVRLEIPGQSSAALPPFFILKVPAFGVAAKVKRVWVAQPGPGNLWCGGIVERHVVDKTAKMPWATFVKAAPSYSTQAIQLVD